jgi:hypothetical protein
MPQAQPESWTGAGPVDPDFKQLFEESERR